MVRVAALWATQLAAVPSIAVWVWVRVAAGGAAPGTLAPGEVVVVSVILCTSAVVEAGLVVVEVLGAWTRLNVVGVGGVGGDGGGWGGRDRGVCLGIAVVMEAASVVEGVVRMTQAVEVGTVRWRPGLRPGWGSQWRQSQVRQEQRQEQCQEQRQRQGQ